MTSSKEIIAFAKDYSQAICHGFQDEFEIVAFKNQDKIYSAKSTLSQFSASVLRMTWAQKIVSFFTSPERLSLRQFNLFLRSFLMTLLLLSFAIWVFLPDAAAIGRLMFIDTNFLILGAYIVSLMIRNRFDTPKADSPLLLEHKKEH